MSNEMLVIAPVIIAVLTGAVAAVADAFASRAAGTWVAVAGLIVAGGVALERTFSGSPVTAYGIFMGGAGFSFIVAIIMLLAAAALAGGSTWFSTTPGGGVAAALMALSGAAASALACSADVLLTLIALETVAICAYGMLSQARTDCSSEAGMKYLVQGAVAAGLLIVGLGMVLAVGGGVTGFGELRGRLGLAVAGAGATALAGAMGFVVAALGFKLSAFPFHSWAPDTFECAPPASAGFMSGAVKIGAVFSAYALTVGLFSDLPAWTVSGSIVGRSYSLTSARVSVVWAVLAAGSIVFGNLGALKQTSFGRMLGYSGIAQVGYVLVGLASGGQTVPAGIMLVSAYAVAVMVAFLGAEAVRTARPDWDGSIAGMAGFGRQHPLVGASMAVALFSLTGIPLTAGFWGKLVVFGNGMIAGREWLVVLGLLGSVVSFGYYGRALRSLYFDTEEGSGGRVSRITAGVAALLALVVLVAGVGPLVSGLSFFGPFFTFGG